MLKRILILSLITLLKTDFVLAVDINKYAAGDVIDEDLQLVPPRAETVPMLKTRYGKISGVTHEIFNGSMKIDAFYGVPYAQPPVGELRLERPVAPYRWSGVLLADRQSPACIPHARPKQEWKGAYSEDCLYLNIFTPHYKKSDEEAGKKCEFLPVVMAIHSGGFEVGSMQIYSRYEEVGEHFVSYGIVFVAVQYRLGVVGFASTGDRTLAGNYGLWDQLEALRFVRENARALCADVKRISIMGSSAGAVSASMLAASPHSRGEFNFFNVKIFGLANLAKNAAIQFSGSVMAAWATSERVLDETRTLFTKLGCFNAATGEEPSSLDIKNCLKSKSVDEIFDAVQATGPTRPDDINFVKYGPRLDGVFFPRDYPYLIIESVPKPTMIGMTAEEMLLFVQMLNQNGTVAAYAIPWDEFDQYDERRLKDFIANTVAPAARFGEAAAQQIQSKIFDFYCGNASANDNHFYLQKYTQILSDIQFVAPILWEARIKMQSNWPIYLYHNAYVNEDVFPAFVKTRASFHEIDHHLLFHDPNFDYELNDRDRKVQKFLVRSIVNFVRKGNPSAEEVIWARSTKENGMRYLQIEADAEFSIKKALLDDRLQFWVNLVEEHRQYNILRGIHLSDVVHHDEL